MSKFPTEVIDLPSKGLVYPKEHPLSSGKLELKYMTAREEDILTSPNLIDKGLVFEMLLDSLIVDDKISQDDLIVGDRNAVLVSARILGYGKDYGIMIDEQEVNVDLTTLNEIWIDEKNLVEKNKNEFQFVAPVTKTKRNFS